MSKENIDWKAIEAELEQAIERLAPLGLPIEVIGNWLWVTGAEKADAPALQEAGFCWSKSKARWYYHPKSLPFNSKGEKAWPMEKIYQTFGSQSRIKTHTTA